MKRPDDSIDRILRHAGSDTDARKAKEWLRYLEKTLPELMDELRSCRSELTYHRNKALFT